MPTLHRENRELGVAHGLEHARFIRFRRKPRRSRIAIDRRGPSGARRMDREVEDIFEFDDVVEEGSTVGKSEPARLRPNGILRHQVHCLLLMPAADFSQTSVAGEYLAAAWRRQASFGAVFFPLCDCTRHGHLRTRITRAHEWRGAPESDPALFQSADSGNRRRLPDHRRFTRPSAAVIGLSWRSQPPSQYRPASTRLTFADR